MAGATTTGEKVVVVDFLVVVEVDVGGFVGSVGVAGTTAREKVVAVDVLVVVGVVVGGWAENVCVARAKRQRSRRGGNASRIATGFFVAGLAALCI